MKSIVDKLKLAGLGLTFCFMLNNCEPVEDIKPNYSKLEDSLELKPRAWERRINVKMYDAASELTHPFSEFHKQTLYAKYAWEFLGNQTTYTFRNIKVVDYAFDPEQGSVWLSGEFSKSGEDYRTCYIGLVLEGNDPLKISNWKLADFAATSP